MLKHHETIEQIDQEIALLKETIDECAKAAAKLRIKRAQFENRIDRAIDSLEYESQRSAALKDVPEIRKAITDIMREETL